ncbi:hypothetical protein LINPERHAP1_LOCUS15423 [Linum perenne]
MHIVDLDRSCVFGQVRLGVSLFQSSNGRPLDPLRPLPHFPSMRSIFLSLQCSFKRMVIWIRFPHLPTHFYHGPYCFR